MRMKFLCQNGGCSAGTPINALPNGACFVGIVLPVRDRTVSCVGIVLSMRERTRSCVGQGRCDLVGHLLALGVLFCLMGMG
jgi:hypothetical protein